MDKNTTKLMFSSKSNDWATPQSFFDKLDGLFGPFTLDAAASADNYKVANYYTEADDSLSQDWSGNRVFLNPPYGRALKDWIRKGYEEGQKDNTVVVMLIPARTDTKYWHDYVMKADDVSPPIGLNCSRKRPQELHLIHSMSMRRGSHSQASVGT